MTTIGIIGNSGETLHDKAAYDFAYQLGKALAASGYAIVCGGGDGIMEAAAKGAKTVRNSVVICILKEDTKDRANPFCDIIIPSGMGIARNILIANTADALVAIAGGSGTLSEMAFGWQKGKPILAVTLFEGWAKQLAGKALDNRRDDRIIPVSSIEQIIEFLKQL